MKRGRYGGKNGVLRHFPIEKRLKNHARCNGKQTAQKGIEGELRKFNRDLLALISHRFENAHVLLIVLDVFRDGEKQGDNGEHAENAGGYCEHQIRLRDLRPF